MAPLCGNNIGARVLLPVPVCPTRSPLSVLFGAISFKYGVIQGKPEDCVRLVPDSYIQRYQFRLGYLKQTLLRLAQANRSERPQSRREVFENSV